jgi:outer membrane protein insertion porin family
VHLTDERPRSRVRHIPSSRAFPFLVSLLLCSCAASAQPLRQPTGFEITSLRFSGTGSFSDNDLRAQLTTRESPGWLNKFLYHSISEKLGSKTEYFARDVFAADLVRLRRFYENRGFSDVRIDTMINFDSSSSTVDITIKVAEGYHSLIDTLVYRGITQEPGPLQEQLNDGPRLARGDPFSLPALEEEVKRVLRVLLNNGYPNANYLKDSSSATRYASTRNYAVVLAFRMGKRCFFGPITVAQELDSLRGDRQRTDITDDLIFRYMDYAPGEPYSLALRVSSEEKLNRLGVFDLRQIVVTIPSDTSASNEVPSLVLIRPRDKHELAPELIVSDDNNAFNLGVGLGYTNRNFWGEARILSARARFRTQTLSKFPKYFASNSDAVSNFDLTLELLQPYFFSNLFQLNWSLSYIVDKQVPYVQNIFRHKFGVTGRFARYTTGYAEWTIDGIGLLKSTSFEQSLSDPATLLQVKRLQEQQFSSVFSFTIQRDKSNDLFGPSAGFIHTFTFEESGLVGAGLIRVFPRLRTTQFLRFNVLGRWYMDQGDHRFSILAVKARAGVATKYGGSLLDSNRVIPQTQTFFGGGSGSVRGWQSRELIAGGNPQLGGNVILEGSVELRTNILQALHDGFWDKIWIVPFIDLGNVWQNVENLRWSDIAVGAGFGLRYDTLFGPFRVDWGFRIYDPGDPDGRLWITDRRLVGDTFRKSVIHFGIGHAF